MCKPMESTDYGFKGPISLKTVYDTACGATCYSTLSECFMSNFLTFSKIVQTPYTEHIPAERLMSVLKDERTWRDWFMKRGLLISKPIFGPVTYARGDRLIDNLGKKARIVTVDPNMVCIINMDNCNRWTAPVKVNDVTRITDVEFKAMEGIAPGTWKKEPLIKWRRYAQLPPFDNVTPRWVQ